MAAKTAQQRSKTVAPASNKKKNADAISTIDFPREDEPIVPGHYTVRISGKATEVEISQDGGAWLPCRLSVGFFWFDWNPASHGEHVFTVRSCVGKGRWTVGNPRVCRVIGGGSD